MPSPNNRTPKSIKMNSKSRSFTRTKDKRTFSLLNAKKRLNGSRFRKLNEKLYTSTSNENLLHYRSNPNLYDIYHEGYKQQVSQWPFNPLTRVITWLKGMDKGNVIGDFGCGEAQIAQAFPDRMVYSFDLVAGNPLITACNIAKVPMDDDTLDISIFCLSLMGSDWPMFLLEGTRCLKQGGILKIVEVKSRFSDINGFDRFIESLGYKKQCDTTPNESDFFVYCQFKLTKKLNRKQDALPTGVRDLLLPCPYKRR